MAVTYTYLEPAHVAPRSVSIYFSDPARDHFAYGATDGASLLNTGGWQTELWADNNQTLSGGGTAQCYFQSGFAVQLGLGTGSNGWARAPDYDITVPAGLAKQGYLPSLLTPGLGMPTVIKRPYRIAFDLSSVVLSGGGLTIIITTYAARPGQ